MLRQQCCAWASLGRPHSALFGRPLSVETPRRRVTVAATEGTAGDKEWEEARPFDAIPGPEPLPLVGNLWRFLPGGNLSKMTNIAVLHKYFYDHYGKIVKLEGIPGRRSAVFVYTPEDAEKVFRNEGVWPTRQGLNSVQYYRTVTRKEFFKGAEGLLESQGEEWGKFRTTVNQPMMQPRVAKHYIAPIDEVASDFINRIRKLRDERGEMPPDFINELYKWALESIAMVALDTRLGCLEDNMTADSEPQKMIDSVQIIFDSFFKLDVQLPLWKIISTPAWRRFVKTMDYFRDVSMKYINQSMERSKNARPNETRELSILERILARDPNPRVACVMALDMMSAGVDTTSNSVAFVLHLLATNPEKQKKLQEEVDRVIPRSNQPITAENLNDLKYLKACIKESLRLKPIALGNMRTIAKDVVLHNYRVPQGTDVAIGNELMCGLEEYFPQADQYIPERWLKGEASSGHRRHPFVYMPFGFGPRMCVGRRFAELELEVLVTKIMQNFNLEWHHDPLESECKLLQTVKSPLRFRMILRTNQSID